MDRLLGLFAEDPPAESCRQRLLTPRKFVFDVAFEFLVLFALREHLALFSS
jgi:hypothetical protein